MVILFSFSRRAIGLQTYHEKNRAPRYIARRGISLSALFIRLKIIFLILMIEIIL